MADNKQIATQILAAVGGKDNVTFVTHCITRLRFNLKDQGVPNDTEIKGIKGVIGVQNVGGQYQVIVGQNVDDVYNELCRLGGFKSEEAIDENLDGDISAGKEPFSIKTVFDVLSACVVPVVPALCGSGIIKGVMLLLSLYGGIDTTTGLYVILNAVSDSPFYFLPFLVAYGASKRFNTSIVLSMVLAGVYLHPTISALAGSSLDLFGLPINVVAYSSTIFPIIISIWLMSYLNRLVERVVPSALRFVLAPTVTLFVMAFLSLGIIGPLGYNIGYYLGIAVSYLFNLSPLIGGLVLGAIRPFVILTGMQSVFTPIITNNIAMFGADFISPVHTVNTMACAGVCIGAFLRAHSSDDRESCMSFFVSAFIGVTEPALYGLIFRVRSFLIALVVSGALSGAVVAAMGAMNVSGIPLWTAFAAYGETMPALFAGLAVAFVSGFIAAWFLGWGDQKTNAEA